MPSRYWDPELETAPWQEVLRWQAALVVPFVRALPERSAFHRTLLGRTPRPETAADLDFLADLPFTTKDEIRRSQAERGPASRSDGTRACRCRRWSRPCPPRVPPANRSSSP
jgi:phenylacetate-coenzyme A ligase PaaK-like adenylate-forming protein